MELWKVFLEETPLIFINIYIYIYIAMCDNMKIVEGVVVPQ